MNKQTSEKMINVTQSSMPSYEDYIEEIKVLWDNHWLTNMGIKHQELEMRLRDFLEVDNITLFSNGHLALETVIAAFDLKGEVITTPYTFASTTHAIVRNGLTPVFCDINPKDFTMDVTKIEELITEKTSAIIPVHVYGNICDVKEIQRIAEKYNLIVIYDAAHTFGVKLDNIGIGNFGDASMFSFHATKVFNTIEGGAVVYKDSNLSSKLDALKNFGITAPDHVEFVGGNAKLNEFQAAMGICNLRNIQHEIKKRKVIFDRYIDNLKKIEGVQLPQVPDMMTPNYSYFPVIFSGFVKTRDEIFEEFKNNNITARKYFYPITSEFECYKGFANGTPVAKEISENVLTLPMYADLEISDVDRICKVIENLKKK